MDPQPAQHHKIMRQVLEVRGCDAADAPRVQAALRAAFYRRLLPSIEKTCSALSTPGRVHRIGILEIDLGEVAADDLESAIADRFERVFTDELAASLGSVESIDTDIDLELYSHFVRSGTVPWWADRSDRQLLDKSLEALIGRDPRGLRSAIESAPDQETVWRRIALAHPDRQLDNLAGVLTGRHVTALPGLGTEWLALIEMVGRAHGHPTMSARNLWWEELLRVSSAGRAPASDAPQFFGDVCLRLARRLAIEYPALIEEVHRALDHPDLSIQSWVRAVVEAIRHDALGEVSRMDVSATAEHRELARLLAECESAGQIDAGAWARVKILLDGLPSGDRAEALARIRRKPGGSALLMELGSPAEPARRPELAREPGSGEPEPASMDPRFSDADEVYVHNAGLVILWPFLEPFFARLGLLTEKQFSDSAARQRGVGLLQCLAAEDAAAPEYDLPLNKVLCGMPLDDVFDFGAPITDAEMEACSDLLAAAIHHAPILHEMSIAGFRHSFLLREGQLSVRDGHWLLRVERQTHDIVLDRFPWSARIVTLPWMAAIMAVEW